jgi:hypothetical protein
MGPSSDLPVTASIIAATRSRPQPTGMSTTNGASGGGATHGARAAKGSLYCALIC